MFLKSGIVFYYTELEDYVYLLTNQFQGILRWNFREDIYDIEATFPEELCESVCPAFEKIIGYKNELYLFPDGAEDIYVYNLDNKRFVRLYISLENGEWGTRGKYLHGVVCGEKLYCISITNPTYVIEIDINTKEYSVYYFENIIYTKNWETKGYVYPIDCLTVINQDIVLPYMESKILKFNMTSKTFCCIEINNLNKEPFNDYVLGVGGTDWNDYWIYSACGKVYRIRNGVTQEWKIPATPDFMGKTKYGDNNELAGFGLGYLILSDSRIYFISWSDYKILKYDIRSDKFSWIKNPYVQEQTPKTDVTYEKAKKIGENQILLYSYCEYAFYLFDTEKEIFTRSIIQLSDDEVEKNMSGFVFKNKFLTDNLEMLFKRIQMDDETGEMNQEEAMNGARIWEQA